MSCSGRLRVEAPFERVANPACPNAQRIQRQAEPRRQSSATCYPFLLVAGIVFEDERAIVRAQPLQAPVQAIEQRFVCRAGRSLDRRGLDCRLGNTSRLVQAGPAMIGAAY